jgi:hypothetical protein
MLVLHKGLNAENIVVTLTEKTTIANASYLFVFTHSTTQEVVKFIKTPGSDLSSWTNRYNEFQINTDALFTTVGQYTYQVYEQASTTNEDITGLTEVENGRADLIDDESFTYTTNKPDVNYKTYAG